MTRTALGLTLLAAGLAAPATAWAGKCDALVAKSGSAEGEALVQAYEELLACDVKEAKAAFIDFMTASGDASTLTDLSVVAIDKKAYPEVWSNISKIKDFSARGKVVEGVGEACADHPEVVTFLKGAFFGLRPIEFGHWAGAYVQCDNPDLEGFLKSQVTAPPKRTFDEKYNTVLKIWTDRKGKDALEALQTAAVAAAEEGPFTSILESMNRAVQPTGLGATMSDADRKLLEQALVNVAGQVAPDKAKAVADRLFNAGAEQAAASLLPVIYKDRLQEDGTLMYGVASVEACDGEAVIHYTTVTEGGKLWSIAGAVDSQARSFKPKLKCDAGEWPVLFTPEPVKGEDEVDAWVEEREAEWAGKGNDVKTKGEKGFSI